MPPKKISVKTNSTKDEKKQPASKTKTPMKTKPMVNGEKDVFIFDDHSDEEEKKDSGPPPSHTNGLKTRDGSPENATFASLPNHNKNKTKTQPIIATLSSSFSYASNVVSPTSGNTSISSLSAFGLELAHSGDKGNIDKNSTLRCCLIEMPDGTDIMFRIQPNDPQNPGSWSEKVMFDCIRLKKNWTLAIGVDPYMMPWHHNNIKQENARGYPIRLFKIKVKKRPKKNQLLKLGQHICEQINAQPGNQTTMEVNQDDFFWLDDKAVWSDVIGCDASMEKLFRLVGQPLPGFYELHHKLIHCYFKPGTLSAALARILHAPIDQIHPSQKAMFEDNDEENKEQDVFQLDDTEEEE